MDVKKITTIFSIVLGVVGALFLALIIGEGDDSIEMSAMQGDFGSVSYIIYLAQFILFVTVVTTVFFSFKNLAGDKKKLKKVTDVNWSFSYSRCNSIRFLIW